MSVFRLDEAHLKQMQERERIKRNFHDVIVDMRWKAFDELMKPILYSIPMELRIEAPTANIDWELGNSKHYLVNSYMGSPQGHISFEFGIESLVHYNQPCDALERLHEYDMILQFIEHGFDAHENHIDMKQSVLEYFNTHKEDYRTFLEIIMRCIKIGLVTKADVVDCLSNTDNLKVLAEILNMDCYSVFQESENIKRFDL